MSAHRTSFHFPSEAAGQLNAILERTYLANYADVIRAALRAYDDLLRIASDHKIFVRDKYGKLWPYSPHVRFSYPGLDALKPRSESNGHAPKNFFFSGEAVKRLESIQHRSHLKSNPDAIRAALSAFIELIAVDAAGDEIIVRDREGNERPYSPHTPFFAEEASSVS